jgi:hypothetical protein
MVGRCCFAGWVLLAGCAAGGGSDAGGVPGADLGGSDLAPADSAAAGGDLARPASVSFSGQLVEDGTGALIAGGMVCPYQHPEFPCATSDAAGKFTVELPQNSDTTMLIDASGYGRQAIAFQTIVYPFASVVVPMRKAGELQAFYGAAGVTYPDPAKGTVRVFFQVNATPVPVAAATAVLSPASGNGPLYAAMSGAYDAMLTRTSAAGIVRFGGVSPVASTEVDAHCSGAFTLQSFGGWPTADRAKGRIPIVAGYETYLAFSCSN